MWEPQLLITLRAPMACIGITLPYLMLRICRIADIILPLKILGGTTSIAEIRKIIKSLKTRSSYGYDNFCKKMLKVSTLYIISPLTYFCNESLAQGFFLDRFKFAVIKPILKNGVKCEPSNCRPISLLSSFSKVFGRLIYNRLF
jgi:hypothetical protein